MKPGFRCLLWRFAVFVLGAFVIAFGEALWEHIQGVNLEAWQTYPPWCGAYVMGIWWSWWGLK